MGKGKKTEKSNTEEPANAEIQIEVTPAEAQISDESADETEEVTETPKTSKTRKTESPKTQKAEEPTAQEKELMRLYPQYEKMWITPNGFVHPEDAPEYMRRGAKLLNNVFYNK